MKILVDDQPYTMTGNPGQNIGDLANEVAATSQSSGARLVVSLRCNGRSVAAESLTTVLSTPVSQFEQIELQTQPVASLVRSTLDQAVRVLEESNASRERVADLLTEGQREDAMRELQKFIDVWRQVQQTLLIAARTLEIDLDSLTIGQTSLPEVLNAIKCQFNELRGAMEQGDFVVVSDILRYELTAPFQQFAEYLRYLRDQVGPPVG